MAGRTLVVVTILISIFKPNNASVYTTSPLSARGVLRTLSKQSGGMEAEITLPLPSKNHPQGFHPLHPLPPPKKTNKQTWEKINLHNSLRSMAVLSSRAQERRSREIRARSARERAAKPREK